MPEGDSTLWHAPRRGELRSGVGVGTEVRVLEREWGTTHHVEASARRSSAHEEKVIPWWAGQLVATADEAGTELLAGQQ